MNKYSRLDLLKMLPASGDTVSLDLGCGDRKQTGFIGLDVSSFPGVDLVCNLEEGFPLEDNSVDFIYSNFFFEHYSNKIQLFTELFRICRGGATVRFRVPSYQSITQYKDPTHKSIIVPEMMRYFSREKFYGSDYHFDVNFKVLNTVYFYLPPFDRFLQKRFFFLWPFLYPFLLFGRRFLWNVVHSVEITVCVLK